ncbi:tetratricopeptide repeat protein [Jannaschia seohaensis]|uniref:Tetratricopeptide repeat protein n=1 Tax=Jannaschia seohaensis TaxID=475081 RepID=A0A2Y9B6L9_9RHOB|nr:tetratricopeptide repeat protein [Jannaschia seohaensis]PWJ15020.1 tetratricopeptide repeat protein [Jannaschia seohaensis]SSA49869.1 Tetratricopeptide repeat-containing protein [Jannaschia seohaensis]
MRALGPLALVALAVGCTPTDTSVGRGAADLPLVAPGVALGETGVDPLIVGDRLLAAGEAELALDAYLRAAAQRGMTQGVLLSLASANIELGRLGQAEKLLRDVLEDDPDNAGALNNLGVVLLEQGEYGEAHRVLRAAFALQPTPEIRDNLRVAGTKLASRTYPDAQNDNAFKLTERGNGVVTLSAPRP